MLLRKEYQSKFQEQAAEIVSLGEELDKLKSMVETLNRKVD